MTPTALPAMTTTLPLPSVQVRELEQKAHSEKVIALLIANAKARRCF